MAKYVPVGVVYQKTGGGGGGNSGCLLMMFVMILPAIAAGCAFL